MYLLSTDKVHATLEIMQFKGQLSPNDTEKIEEGKTIQFNRYHVSAKRKDLEQLANKIKDQWIRETYEQIRKYENLKVKIRWNYDNSKIQYWVQTSWNRIWKLWRAR